MALKAGKQPNVESHMVECHEGVATMNDGETFTFPEGTTFVEQDPELPAMTSGTKKSIQVVPKAGAPFYLIGGATRQTVLAAIEKCK